MENKIRTCPSLEDYFDNYYDDLPAYDAIALKVNNSKVISKGVFIEAFAYRLQDLCEDVIISPLKPLGKKADSDDEITRYVVVIEGVDVNTQIFDLDDKFLICRLLDFIKMNAVPKDYLIKYDKVVLMSYIDSLKAIALPDDSIKAYFDIVLEKFPSKITLPNGGEIELLKGILSETLNQLPNEYGELNCEPLLCIPQDNYTIEDMADIPCTYFPVYYSVSGWIDGIKEAAERLSGDLKSIKGMRDILKPVYSTIMKEVTGLVDKFEEYDTFVEIAKDYIITVDEFFKELEASDSNESVNRF